MHTPEEVAASIKEIIKQKSGNLNAYAQEKNITPTTALLQPSLTE